MSDIQYGDLNGGTGEANSAMGSVEISSQFIAAGAFSDSGGLVPDGTPFSDFNDWMNYLGSLTLKEFAQFGVDKEGVSITFDGAEQFFGLGGRGADTLEGNASDTSGFLRGYTGNDYLAGGSAGNDLWGGGGADTLVSSGGGDHLSGGSGADTIRFTDLTATLAADLTHLENTGDVIDLTAAAAAHGGSSFQAVSRFDGAPLEIKAVVHGHSTTFAFDLDGDGKTDSKIFVRGGDYSDYSHFVGVTPETSSDIHAASAHDHHALVI